VNERKRMYEEYLETVRELKALLYSRGLTYAYAAKALGVSPRTVGFWFNGKSIPHPKYIEPLSKLLHIDAKELAKMFLTVREYRKYEDIH